MQTYQHVISILFAVISLPLFAQANGRFSEDRTYVHHLFASKAECAEAKKKAPFLNCDQWVKLRKDGSATLIVTDIVNPGSYEVEDQKVVVTLNEGIETARVLTFTFDPDERTLRLEPDGAKWVWEKRP